MSRHLTLGIELSMEVKIQQGQEQKSRATAAAVEATAKQSHQ
jgi:hypothetical protein